MNSTGEKKEILSCKELDETKLAADVAFAYLEEGFLDEAHQVLDKARRLEEVHPKVWDAFVELIKRKEQAEERKSLILARFAISSPQEQE